MNEFENLIAVDAGGRALSGEAISEFVDFYRNKHQLPSELFSAGRLLGLLFAQSQEGRPTPDAAADRATALADVVEPPFQDVKQPVTGAVYNEKRLFVHGFMKGAVHDIRLLGAAAYDAQRALDLAGGKA